MTTYFFPSCKVKQQFPQTSARLLAYLQKRWSVTPAGCCRQNRRVFSPQDELLTICNTCAHILGSSQQARLLSVWELIDRDADFPFPDYQNEPMTLQDCWLAADKPALQQAARSLLRKMRVDIHEMPDNLAETRFCGVKTSAETLKLAPQMAKLPPQMPPEERAAYLRQSPTEKIVCYCRPCLHEINSAGRQGIHLLQMLFPGQD